MKFSSQFATAPLVALALAAATTLPASADPAHGTHFLVRNQGQPGLCMDASLDRTQEGHEIYAYHCHGRYNQRWTFTDGADGSSAVIGFDGKCADIRGRSVRDNSPIQLWRCHYGANQQFQYLPSGQIKELQSGKCLTIRRDATNRSPVYIDDCDGNRSQLWTLNSR